MSDSQTEENPLSLEVSREERLERLLGYFLRYKWWFAIGAVFLVLTNIQQLYIPSLLGDAVEAMRNAEGSTDLASKRPELVEMAIFIILLAIGGAVTRIFSRIAVFNPGRYIEFDIRNELYDKLTRLTPSFYGPAPTGDLTSRVTNDIKHVRLFFAIGFLHIVNTSVAYAIAIWRMMEVDWQLTLICLAPFPVLLFGIRKVVRLLFHQTKIVQSHLSDISSKVQENLGGMSVVKSYTLEGRETEAFKGLNEEFFDKNMKLATIRGGLNSLIVLVAGSGTLMLLVIGSYWVVSGRLTLGQFVEFNGYVVALAFPTIAMGWVFAVWHRGLAAFDRVVEILFREPALDDPSEDEVEALPPVEEGVKRGGIEFDGVSFTYEGADETEGPVLKDIDIDIPPGSTVAIVGKTGSGKSTLVRLLSRLYDPDTGEIRLDGVPLDRVPLRRLRSEIGYVPQEPFLFSMTVGQNIRFGIDALERDETIEREPPTSSMLAEDAGSDRKLSQDERIEQAVDVAGLRPDIEGFPDGLETVVGERGVTLSGGQKQRVTIARALLVDPRVLILDDALSAVDTKTEQVILDHLDVLMRDRTSIILTHRFNSLKRVDQIFVMDEGRIVERGSHDALMASGGLYAEMYERQQLEEKLEDDEV